jgi:hypothetical protein
MSIRQFLISTVALAILPAAILHASDSVEYVGGTVKSIPLNSVGILDLDDTKVLKYNYGSSIYKLPYAQITGTEIAKGETRHVLKKVPIPSMFGWKKETLTISYKDAAGVTGKLSFELSGRQATSVQNTIAEQKALPEADAQAAADASEWWGDRYWKTLRNKSNWDTGAAAANQPAPVPAPATKN